LLFASEIPIASPGWRFIGLSQLGLSWWHLSQRGGQTEDLSIFTKGSHLLEFFMLFSTAKRYRTMNFQDSKIHFWVFHVGFRRFKRQPLKVAALRWQVLTASVERLHLANWQNADLLLVTVTLVAANR